MHVLLSGLFRFSDRLLEGDIAIQQAFIQNLLQLVQAPDTEHRVILTMRIDFEERVVKIPGFGAPFEQARIQVTPLEASELREAIEKPAELIGLKFENGLVDALIKDALGEPAALPLLQFTLLKLWENRDHNRLTWAAYQKLGGGRKALAHSADDFFDSLIPQQQETAKRILLAMVQIKEGIEFTSQRIPRQRLYRSGEARDQVDAVLNKLIQARLVRLTQGDSPHEAQVEVAHEALIRNWERLGDWLNEARGMLRQRIHLTALAEQWRTRERDPKLALRGSLLREAQGYEDLDTLTLEFVEFSVKAEQAEAEVERKQWEEKLKLEEKLKSRKKIAISSGIVIILLGFTTAWAVSQQLAAQQAQKEVQIALQVARSGEFLLSRNQTFSALIEALIAAKDAKQAQLDPRTQQEVYKALQQAIYSNKEVNRLEWGASEVTSVRFSSDGELIATGDDQHHIQIWNPQGGLLQTLDQGSRVTSLTFTTNNQVLASASEDGTIKLWQRNGSKPFNQQAGFTLKVRDKNDHQNKVRSLAFSTDGTTLISGNDDGTISQWKWSGQAWRQQQAIMAAPELSYVAKVFFNPKYNIFASGSDNGSIQLWHSDGHSFQEINGKPKTDQQYRKTSGVWSLTFSPDGEILAIGNGMGKIELWKRNQSGSFKRVQFWQAHDQPISDISFSQNGQILVTSSTDSSVKVWSNQGSLLDTLFGHTGGVQSISIAPNGVIASAGNDGTVRLWQIQGMLLDTLIGHRDTVTSVHFSPDATSKVLVSTSADNTIKVWGLNNQWQWNQHTPITSPDQEWLLWDTSISSNGQWIVSGGRDQAIKVWSKNLQLLIDQKSIDKVITSISFSPTNSLIASADSALVRLWQWNGSQLILEKTLKGHQELVTVVRFAPKGDLLASASEDRTIRLWRPSEAKEIQRLEHLAPVTSLVFSADEQLLASGTSNGTITVWRLPDGAKLQSWTGSTSKISSLAFQPGSRILVSGGADNTLQFWDPEGQLLKTIDTGSGVQAISFSPDGKVLASAQADKTIKLWNPETLDFDGLIKRACDQASDYLRNNPTAKQKNRDLLQFCEDQK